MSDDPVGKVVWKNGKLLKREDAKIGILTHTLHYGLGAFEGIRCYETHDGKRSVFRLKEHVDRLLMSCKIAGLKVPYNTQEIIDATIATIRESGIKGGCYIRPIVYVGEGPLGLFPGKNPPVELAIITWKWGAYLGKEATEKGARIRTSSYQRGWVNSTMTKGKLTGQYITSILAKVEAHDTGYDEAVLLDPDGYVAEGSGENIFMYRKGVLKTTPLTSVLDGITRDAVITVAKNNGIEVVEQRFTRDELYSADEVFFTGTAAEVTPIREIDNRTVGTGKPGPITKQIFEEFFGIVAGKNQKYKEWLSYV